MGLQVRLRLGVEIGNYLVYIMLVVIVLFMYGILLSYPTSTSESLITRDILNIIDSIYTINNSEIDGLYLEINSVKHTIGTIFLFNFIDNSLIVYNERNTININSIKDILDLYRSNYNNIYDVSIKCSSSIILYDGCFIEVKFNDINIEGVSKTMLMISSNMTSIKFLSDANSGKIYIVEGGN